MVERGTAVENAPVDEKKNKTAKAEQISSPQVSVDQEKSDNGWNIGAMFWGLLLVAFGGLLLLGNLGVVEVNWSELWRLWPLLIVGAGFSVLATTHWLWKVLSAVFVIAAIFAVVWVGTGQYSANTTRLTNQYVSVDADQGVTRADITIRAGASKLNIDSNDTSGVLLATLKSHGLRLVEDVGREGATQKIILSSDNNQHSMWFGPQQNTWDITVTERLPVKLSIEAGASNINADLSKVQLTDLSVKAGASSTVITLGKNQADLNVDIDSGASSTIVRIPKDSGVKMSFDGGLSSREFDDLTEVSEGKYESDNYATTSNRVSINANAGVATFKIERY